VYRFLLTPRWLCMTLGTVAAVVVCLLMGTWQLGRFDDRVASHRAAQHKESGNVRAVPVTTLLGPSGRAVGSDDVGRIVTAQGTYDAGHQLLVPDRTLDDTTGYYILTPLRTSGGKAIPVVRGWHAGRPPAVAPAPPGGEVAVRGALQASETEDTPGVDVANGLPAGQLGLIRASSLVNVLPYPVQDGWITLSHADAGLRAVPSAVSSDSGLDAKAFQNLGYTGEWFVFAGFALFMWFRLVRREGETQRDMALGLIPAPDEPAADGPAPDAPAPDDPARDDPAAESLRPPARATGA
jgi:cytochrome oxidase assembly protein ShyY1